MLVVLAAAKSWCVNSGLIVSSRVVWSARRNKTQDAPI